MRAYLSMPRSFTFGLLTFAAIGLTAMSAAAQNDLFDPAPAPGQDSAYTESAGQLTPRQMVQQKAQVRAEQRMSRIAAAEWFGHSVSRPRTSATPFTGLYGSQFQGHIYGRPAAHHPARPVIVMTR